MDVDLDNDLIILRYDPSKVTPEKMLEVVSKEGFEGKIVSNQR